MNIEELSGNLYSVVRLDGDEKNNVDLETIKEWYFKRQINESSLVFSADIGQWRMLKKVFDIEELKAEFSNRVDSTASVNNFTAPFQNTATAYASPESFPMNGNNSYYQNYSADNQNYQRPPSSPPPPNYYQKNFAETHKRFRLAAIFMLVNFAVWIISTFLVAVLSPEPAAVANPAYRFGELIGKELLKFIIDLYLISRLWNATDENDKSRIFTIIRTYLGTILFLLVLFPFFTTGFYFAGLTALGSAVFYALGLLMLLHGKESSSTSKVQIGWVILVLFVVFSGAAMYGSSKIISESGTNVQAFNDMKKYELPSNEYFDPQTSVKITLPAGWKQYSLDNPYVGTQHAQMMAMDSKGNEVAKLTVYPFPKRVDIPKAKLDSALDQALLMAEPKLKAEDSSYNPILTSSIYLGEKSARRIIFERRSPKTNKKTKGHLIFTMDNQNAYILEMWCDEDFYPNSTGDFAQFESNFSVP